jgi:hypothetical protein
MLGFVAWPFLPDAAVLAGVRRHSMPPPMIEL